jgi:hypothetical protein
MDTEVALHKRPSLISPTTQLSSTRWRYDYIIHNHTLGKPLKEFTIFFREELFAKLSNASSLAARMQPMVNIALGASLSTVFLTVPTMEGRSLTTDKLIQMALPPV